MLPNPGSGQVSSEQFKEGCDAVSLPCLSRGSGAWPPGAAIPVLFSITETGDGIFSRTSLCPCIAHFLPSTTQSKAQV